MKLIERERQLGVLRRLFETCASGRSGIVVASGVVASGKTALLHAFIDEAESSGAVILQANADHADAAQPLGVIDEMFSNGASLPGADQSARLRLDSMRLAIPSVRFAIAGSAAETGETVRPQVVSGLAEMLFELGETRCVVICVDDVHQADPYSLDFLLHLARRLRAKRARILMVLSERVGAGHHHPRFYAELIRHPHHHHLQLPLLSQAGITELLGYELGVERARVLAPSCHALTGGNPLLIQGLVEDHRASIDTTATELLPDDAFGRAASICLYRSEPAVLRTAQAIAMLGGHASKPVLVDFLDIDPELLDQHVRALESSGLLLAGRFRHEEIRRAAMLDLDTAERARLRARAARTLYEHGLPAAVVAEHLLAVGDVRFPWMAGVLRKVAEQALADDRTEFAIDCLRLCGQVAATDRERVTVRAMLSRAEWRVDPAKTLRHLPELTAAAQEGRLDGEQATTVLCHLLWFGHVDQVVKALDGAGSAGSDEIRRLLARWYPARRDGSLDAPPADAGDEQRVPRDLCLGEHAVMTAGGALELLARIGRLEEMPGWYEVLLEVHDAGHSPTGRALLEAVRASAAAREGRITEAATAARTALALLPAESWGVAIGLPLAEMLHCATAMRAYGQAASCLNVPVPEPMFETVAALPYLQARGRYHLAVGRPHAALKDFETCGELTSAWRIDTPLDTWRADAAMAWIALDQPYMAKRLITEQIARVRPQNFAARGGALRVLAALVDEQQRPAILREAVELTQESGDRYATALALAELGRSHHALGDERSARGTIRVAEHLAEENGFQIHTEAPPLPADRRTPEAGLDGSIDITAIAQLSRAELRVAVLAGKGHSNRQIADELSITVSTVEQHLTRVYRKLEVTGRADLFLKLKTAASTGGSMPRPSLV